MGCSGHGNYLMKNTPFLIPAAVIIPAAGSGSRMGADIPKQFLLLGGEPILCRTVQQFLEVDEISLVVVVVPPSLEQKTKQILDLHLSPEFLARLIFAQGGTTRQESVRSGLATLPTNILTVLVHDGARPLVDRAVIHRCLAGVAEHGAVIAALPVNDTIKRVDSNGKIDETVDRSALWRAQTPQGAKRHLIEQAFVLANKNNFIGTDEASLLEHSGVSVTVVAGSEENLKITRPEDIIFAEKILCRRDQLKIGHGYDAHRLVEGRNLVIGGVNIDYHLGLAGHSDADVLTHAFMDALLGAMGKGDIGGHFPDNDPTYKGISSLKLLEHVVGIMKQEGTRLVNGDITIVCQRPKLAPHIASMRSNLAAICEVSPELINIKATTTEKMGFPGREEGIATHAVVLLGSN